MHEHEDAISKHAIFGIIGQIRSSRKKILRAETGWSNMHRRGAGAAHHGPWPSRWRVRPGLGEERGVPARGTWFSSTLALEQVNEGAVLVSSIVKQGI